MTSTDTFFPPGRLVKVSSSYRSTGASVLAQPDVGPRPPGWKPDWQLPTDAVALLVCLARVADGTHARTWALIVYDSRVGWAPVMQLTPA